MNVFFDLDGTLLDCRKRVHALFRDLCNGSGLEFEPYWMHKRAGRSNEWILSNLLGYSDAAVSKFVADWLIRIESDEYLSLDEAFPFTEGVLRRLSEHHHKIFVVTSRQKLAAARTQIDTAKLSSYISDVWAAGPSRSKADIREEVAKFARRDDFFAGDTGEDINFAKSLGVRSVAVLCGVRDFTVLRKYDPDFIYKDISGFCRSFLHPKPTSTSCAQDQLV